MGKLYLLVAFTLAGSSVVAARFLSGYIQPFTTTFLSLAAASVTAVLFYGKKMYHTAKRLSTQSWITLLLQAVFGSLLFRIFLTAGLQHIGAAEAGIITGATPAITALLTWVMVQEPLNRCAITGVFTTFAGVLLAQGFPFAISGGGLKPLGIILVLCAAASESMFTTLTRKIQLNTQGKEAIPPLAHSGLVSILAMALCVIPAILERPWSVLVSLPVSGWLALAWYGSIVTIVAFACMFAGAKRCNGYTIAAFAGLIPVSSTLLSVIFLQEAIHLYQIVGCGLVVISTVIISKQNP